MITLHILKYLEDNGFGVIDESLFFEKLPLDKVGIGILSRGGEMVAGRSSFRKRFDLYSRGSDDFTGMNSLELIREFFADGYDELCTLPTISGISLRQYNKCRIVNVGDIENIGINDEDRVIYRLSAEIIYQK